ncbi:hypothetical protein [Modestobacter versicolor]|uniref:Carboxypeptidase regulatory-like domain-containing protein n=1 Tax=Modestobacter versicolor TaxID=429133 RepID=A0A323V7D3_9ACTN|nr:hypothetical protein [Modestobacter versicolor]MBB3674404.1 hypothetical protein [Modestobacter versicolor]PZA20471.1 hypothetical protein DMO24_15280 [Modestobacter versicolor]
MSTSDLPDDELVRRLARAVAVHDPVPPELLAFAREAFTWRTVDAELAELVADSRETAGAGLRGPSDVRLLTFSAGDQQLDLELLVDGATRRLVGELTPAGPAHVVVEHAGGTLTEDADELGRFLVAGVPPGRIRVRCEPAGGTAVVTPWLDD